MALIALLTLVAAGSAEMGAVDKPPPTTHYTVKQRDTLTGIAKLLQVDRTAIVKLNLLCVTNSNRIAIVQVLTVPVTKLTSAKPAPVPAQVFTEPPLTNAVVVLTPA